MKEKLYRLNLGTRWWLDYWRYYAKGDLRERAARWIAWALPREVAMWAYVRVAAHATSGEYGNTHVGELLVMDALKRWDTAES